jgi:hypothetical protein
VWPKDLRPVPSPAWPYCTVICRLAVWLVDPEVAVTVTVDVPEGVPGFEVPPPPPPPLPPQPRKAPPRTRAQTSTNQRFQRATRLTPGISNSNKLPSAKSPVMPARWIPLCTDDCAAVVVMVKVVVTALAPGVTVAGAKVQVASEGRPLQAKVTGCAKPPAGVTETVVVPVAPAVMDRVAGLALIENEGGTAACTVTVTGVEVEAAKLLSPPYCAVMLWAPVANALVE